jgi:hypothetical protein
MDLLIVFGVIVLVLGLSYLFGYLKSKGKIRVDDIDLVNDFLMILRIVLAKNGKDDVRIDKAIEIIQNTLSFIQEQDDMTPEEKKEFAIENILESLHSIDIEVDSQIEVLVKLIVTNTFRLSAK